jgi:hypothetical protein
MRRLDHRSFFFNRSICDFFKPFQIYLELADLTVKFRRHLLVFFVLLPPTIGKYMRNLIQKPLAPL